MKKILWLIPVVVLLCGVIAAWFWWQKPHKIEMAQFAPADALIYLEADDLPEILDHLTATEAWQNHAAEFGAEKQAQFGWWSRNLAWLGIGGAETNVLGRTQIAVVLLGFEATENEQNLQLKPRAVIIAETHSSQSTAQKAVENLVGRFTAANFREPQITQTEAEGAKWTIWTDTPTGRKLFAAIIDGTAFIGNDEQSVKTCLAVKRGERQSLENDAAFLEMRRKLNENGKLAFGLVTANGVKQISEIGTAAYVGKITESATAMSLIAQSLPPLVQKSVNAVGWTAKFADGKIIDRYFIALPDDLSANLREPLATSIESDGNAVQFLPNETKSFTRYNLQNPHRAWNGLVFALTTKLDTLSAVLVGQFSKTVLAPYGIVEPKIFLNAVGTEILTARVDERDEIPLTVFTVRDEKILKNQILQRLQTDTPQTENVGNAVILSAASESDFAAAFAGKFLIVGTPETVRKSLSAQQRNETAAQINRAKKSISATSAVAVTFADETETTQEFMQIVSGRKDEKLRLDSTENGFSITETKLTEGGFERRTTSNFGLFGSLVTQFGAR